MVSSSNACCNCTEMENSRENSAAAYLDMASSVLFLDDFQIQDDVLARVETGHRAGCRLCIVLFRVQFVIRVGVESAEPVTSGVIGIAASHGVGPHVLQENNATGERVVGFVAYHAANGAQLRTVRGVVSDKSDNPLSGSVVFLKNMRTNSVRSSYTDDTGSYRFSGLDPNADYELHAEKDNAKSATRTVSSFDSRKDIVLNLKIVKKKN